MQLCLVWLKAGIHTGNLTDSSGGSGVQHLLDPVIPVFGFYAGIENQKFDTDVNLALDVSCSERWKWRGGKDVWYRSPGDQ